MKRDIDVPAARRAGVEKPSGEVADAAVIYAAPSCWDLTEYWDGCELSDEREMRAILVTALSSLTIVVGSLHDHEIPYTALVPRSNGRGNTTVDPTNSRMF